MKVLLLLILAFGAVESSLGTRFVCYFPNWAFYRTGAGKFTVDNINPSLCSHLIYAFATLDSSTFTIKMFDSWVDSDNQGYLKFNALKQKNSKLKTLIAIGGWNDSQSPKYSQLVADGTKIKTFVDSVVSFLKQYGFDGLDLDWEYPSSPADKAGFSSLLIALRKAFDSNGFVLSAAVAAGQNTVDNGYDVPSLNQNLDFINLMTYDMHGSWETQADHHAPLYQRPWESSNNNVNFIVNYWISKGVAASKINLGVPLYGRSWTLTSNTITPPAPASGPGAGGPLTKENGILAYYEICNNIRTNGWTTVSDPNKRMGPYAYLLTSKNWVGYDDVAMAIVKSQYALSNGLGGVMVWDISMDDFANTCMAGANPLMTAISQTVNGNSSQTTTSNPQITTTIKSATTSVTTSRSTATTTTSTKSTSSGTFVCSGDGLFANPANCGSYYHCANNIAYLMQCPSGLYFNPSLLVCDWPYNVPCNVSG